MSGENKPAERIAIVVAIICFAIAILLGGCAGVPKRLEDVRPAPSSSMTKAQATDFAKTWAEGDRFNRSFSTVSTTGSMTPLIDSRTVLLIEKVKMTDIQFRDLPIYWDGARWVVHVAMAKRQNSVLITGANNMRSDGWIAESKIKWRVAGVLFTQREKGGGK